MTITGLDLSLRATGYCQMGPELGVENVVRFGTIEPPKGMIGIPRLISLNGAIQQLVQANRQLVVLEGFSYGSRGSFSREIAGLGYLVRVELYERGVPYIVVPPATLKKFVTGKGTAQKSLMLREVFRRWNIDAGNDNEADAVGLTQMGAALLDYSTKPLTTFQREVISKLKKDEDVQQALAQFEART